MFRKNRYSSNSINVFVWIKFLKNTSEEVLFCRSIACNFRKNRTYFNLFTVAIITTAQLNSTKPELRFCAGSNPARGVSEIRDGEDLWQWSRLEIRLNAFHRSTIPQKQFFIIIIIIIIKISQWLLLNE